MFALSTPKLDNQRRSGIPPRIALLVATFALAIIVGACAPPPEVPPQGPSVAARLSLTASDSPIVGVVNAEADASNFPGDGNFDVEWTYRDIASGSIVYTTTSVGNADGHLFNSVQPGLFDVALTTSTNRVEVEVTVQATREGATATGSATKTLEWDPPTSPVSGTIEDISRYSVVANTYTACTPVGTQVNVSVSGATSDAYAGFLDLTSPGLADFVAVSPSGTVTLTTTDPCWSAVVARISFAGAITGTMNYTVEWTWPGLPN